MRIPAVSGWVCFARHFFACLSGWICLPFVGERA